MGHFTDKVRLPSAKFPSIGTTVAGVVQELTEADVPDFDEKGRPSGVKTDENGKTLTQVDVTLKTADDKLILLHTDGGIAYAIGRALAEAGRDDLAQGDYLAVSYTADGEATSPGRTAPKQYVAVLNEETA